MAQDGSSVPGQLHQQRRQHCTRLTAQDSLQRLQESEYAVLMVRDTALSTAAAVCLCSIRVSPAQVLK
jgi:hypothetical protein